MVEDNSFSDALASVTRPAANQEHDKALQALQSELEYHRKYVGNATYLDKAVSYVYDAGASDSLHKLEIASRDEQENPNSVSREEVTKLVQQDQKRLHWLTATADTAVGATATALAYFGGSNGKLVATGLIALDSVHPNDSLSQQALEGVGGVGLGMIGSHMFDRGMAMSNQLLGAALSAGIYPLVSMAGRTQWPNQGRGKSPDVEQIYNAEVPKTTYSPYSNLQPRTSFEWREFDFLKK